MRLTKLRLTGFKSFVDPTDLLIHEGLTGVVGPNGCGKSNLLEALRWVMGENRPKAMRGGGMEDVIFAGAATRPARNFAEVALTIDNSERLAPAGFNDSDTLDIVRRITRDVGSAYKVNTKDVRARDVQMLFADASTGAHSPALVRQGQISELINARPKARRRILEEAAGISGLYQRRHEAELKLNATETNLARVDDVIEQLAQQLGQLARQAKQAARYRAIGESLRQAEGLLLYRRWREADEARAKAAEALTARTAEAGQMESAAIEATKAREDAEAALGPLREEEAIAGAVLQRLTVQSHGLDDELARVRAGIDTLTARIVQLGKDIDRERGLNHDAGEVIARLEQEAADLAAAGEGHEARLQAAAEAAHEAAAILNDREARLGTATEDVARLAARHQSVTRLLEDSRKTLTRSEAAATAAKEAMQTARETLARAGTTCQAAQAEETRASAAAEQAEADLAAADTALTETQAREADARAARSAAEGEVGAIEAEVQALARLVAREASDSGQVMDDIRVEAGFEKALGAALADDLRAPLTTPDGPSGWLDLANYDAPQPLPNGVRPLAQVATVPAALARRIGQIGLVDAEQGPDLQDRLLPGQRLVTTDGDLWRWDGFHARAEDAPSAAALRLEQINRIESLKQDLAHVSARASGARQAHEALREQFRDATEADAAARTARREADRRVAEASRALSRAEADRNLAEGKLETLALALARHRDESTEARRQVTEAERNLAGLGDLDAARAGIEELKQVVEAARITMMTRRSAHDDMRREGEDRDKRAQTVARDSASWRSRLETAGTRIAELEERRTATQAELDAAKARPDEIAAEQTKLNAEITSAEARRAVATDHLTRGEAIYRAAAQAERDGERAASEAREGRARAEAVAEAAREAVLAAADRIAEDLQQTPAQLLNALSADPDAMPDAAALEADVNRLKRQRDALGAVNLRAEEDALEVQTEHDTLSSEKADLEEAIRTLRAGIASLNREGRERLLTAFEQVNGNFRMLFTHLFGGGEANLVMVESDDPLEAGLEIMCQPPGKKLATLSLLSGGEQTLTALALIFAVFLANPAPICVLDEVDAPLDDANVGRFCDLLDEMCRRTETRFLIITHHAVTMARMDRLFGVTMAEQGVSQLVSVDLRKAEALVA
ncbi:MAG: chromosome segregation SMC family protein [Marinibacterium sp.]